MFRFVLIYGVEGEQRVSVSLLVLCIHEPMCCVTAGSCVIVVFYEVFPHPLNTKTQGYEARGHMEDMRTPWVLEHKQDIKETLLKSQERAWKGDCLMEPWPGMHA